MNESVTHMTPHGILLDVSM